MRFPTFSYIPYMYWSIEKMILKWYTKKLKEIPFDTSTIVEDYFPSLDGGDED